MTDTTVTSEDRLTCGKHLLIAKCSSMRQVCSFTAGMPLSSVNQSAAVDH